MLHRLPRAELCEQSFSARGVLRCFCVCVRVHGCACLSLQCGSDSGVTAPNKRVDFQIDFGGSINMNFTGKGVTAAGSHICRVEVRDGETQEMCVCRTVDPTKKANLSYETAVAEYLLAADDSDDG